MAATKGALVEFRVRGAKELHAALNAYDKDLKKEMRKELRVVAEPITRLATQLALGEITNMTAHWARMRLGVSAKGVYVVPASRNAGGSSRGGDTGPPNFNDLMLDRALNPALDKNKDRVIVGIEHMLGALANRHGL